MDLEIMTKQKLSLAHLATSNSQAAQFIAQYSIQNVLTH